jgi:hypothetical protein
MIQICQSLLDDRNMHDYNTSGIRVGDVFAQMIEYYYGAQ